MRDRLLAVAALTIAGVLLAAPALAADPSESPSPTASPSTSPTTTTAVEVDNATLRWGINNETSNRAYAPGTVNFMSAGTVPDPGRGGQTLDRADWHQRSGAVRIEKWDGTTWRAATWAGLSTDSAGEPLGSPTAGTFSNHTFVISAGVGTIDPSAGTAHVAWDGEVSVLYYSGMSTFTLSDLVLDVADGIGRLTATVSGYASSVDDPSQWSPVTPRTVTVADLPSVDLGADDGFVAEPAYLGVEVDGVPQHTDGPDAGSFPQSWVDLMDDLGTAAFWYSSGAATDAFKVPLSLTVGYDASTPVVAPTPTAGPTQEPIDNEIVDPPEPTATTTVTARAGPATGAGTVDPPAAPPPSAAAATAPAGAVPRPATETALTLAAASAPEPGPSSLPWWIGSICLLGTALIVALPLRTRRAGGASPQS